MRKILTPFLMAPFAVASGPYIISFILGLGLSVGLGSASQAQQISGALSAQEQALCRPDAIRLCLFSVANADALRACLRRNKPELSPPCRKLIESRGN
jgi:hypothetical protein